MLIYISGTGFINPHADFDIWKWIHKSTCRFTYLELVLYTWNCRFIYLELGLYINPHADLLYLELDLQIDMQIDNNIIAGTGFINPHTDLCIWNWIYKSTYSFVYLHGTRFIL